MNKAIEIIKNERAGVARDIKAKEAQAKRYLEEIRQRAEAASVADGARGIMHVVEKLQETQAALCELYGQRDMLDYMLSELTED